MSLKSSFDLRRKGTFSRSVALLAGGTALGQVATIAVAPVLTRVYSPANFGVLAVYTSLLGLLAGVGSLRYDVAIPVAEDEESASDLLVLSLILLVGTGLILEGIVLLAGLRLGVLLGAPELTSFMWLLPLGIFGASVYQTLGYVAARHQDFNLVARTKLGQGIVQALVQLLSGLIGLNGSGLLVGDVIGRVTGSGALARFAWRNQSAVLKGTTVQSLKRTALRFRRYPLFSSGSYLLNSAGTQLPTLLVTSFYGTQVSGYFALGQRLISIPMVLVGQAVSQVYFAELSRLRREDPLGMLALFQTTIKRLLWLGGMPIALIGVVAPWVFAVIFGAGWKEAGVYTQLLTVMYLAQFLVVPISQSLNVLERQDLQLAWDIGRVVALAGGLTLFHALEVPPRVAIGLYGAIVAGVYLALYLVIAFNLRLVHRNLLRTRTNTVLND